MRSLADIVREESREAIKALKEMGIRTSMITGDSEDVAAWVSKELGIDEYFARVLPHQKSEKVKGFNNEVSKSPWSVMASTMRPHSPKPILA